MYSGHPMGLFPSHKDAPRVVVTNGMMIPNYSKPDDWERFNAMGVTQYGQMTAGSYMYIGPQGIVHGTTITVLNAGRKIGAESLAGKLFVTAGLGGMSGAQPKAANIAGCVSITAEINPLATEKRHSQGWVDEVYSDLPELIKRVKEAQQNKEIRSFAYNGNVVDLWEYLAANNIKVDLGSDQTSLHNPWAGGYYPVGISFEEANKMMAEQPELFKEKVQATLRRHVAAVNKLAANGMYFFDYGNAFLLEAGRAGADVFLAPNPSPKREGNNSSTPTSPQNSSSPLNTPLKESREMPLVEHLIHSKLLEYARELRKNQTDAEEFLWQLLRNRQLNNLKFRRQHPLKANYILDFFCFEHKLGIEIDGGYHNDIDQKEYDKLRTEIIAEYGINIISFTNEDVLNNTDYVISSILEATVPPLSFRRGDGGEEEKTFKYPSYVQDIMGPMCFDYGFGPFRWVCTSGKAEDLETSDHIAMNVLEEIAKNSPKEIQQQMRDNIQWIEGAKANKLVVGSQARILYADCEGRTKIAAAFNQAIREGKISAPIVLGRDHHDVSGTDSPFRETSNIYDGSSFTADMAVQNCIGDSFRGATWVSLHNGGGVGWGEVINGGFGMVIDGSEDADRRLRNMLFWDVNNGISRRSWARNEGAIFAIKRAMQSNPNLKVTLPNFADDNLINNIIE
jgi:urocanate hydratase